MKKEYDETIDQHYKDVAKTHGLSATSTMSDEITRNQETKAISQFVGESFRLHQAQGSSEQATIMDVGCGNGYTLEQLANQYPEHHYVGIEMSNELRALASSRFRRNDRVKIFGHVSELMLSDNLVPIESNDDFMHLLSFGTT